MTVRIFIVGSVLAALVSWTAWILIVGYLDPVRAGWLGYILFFLSLFLAAASTVALVGYLVRRIIAPEQLAAYAVRPALRQGVLVGLFLDSLLILQLAHLYQWWLVVLAVVLFLAVESVFFSYDRVR